MGFMEMERIKKLILGRYPGLYLDENIELLLSSIEKMDSSLRIKLENFLTSGEVSETVIQDYSVERLVKEHKMNELAAFLTLDWIKKEPLKAIMSLKKGYDIVKFNS